MGSNGCPGCREATPEVRRAGVVGGPRFSTLSLPLLLSDICHMPVRPAASAAPAKLMVRFRQALRAAHYSPRTEAAYVAWARRSIRFHGLRHPGELAEVDVAAFLTHLATDKRVASSTQGQALSALLFLSRDVLGLPLGNLGAVLRARTPTRLPVVLSRAEVQVVLDQLPGLYHLLGTLLYGAGLRLHEAVTLRVKDIDFGRGEILLRRGKGGKDRVTVLPESIRGALAAHLEEVKSLHEADLASGGGRAAVPDALARTVPHSPSEPAWQWGFAAAPRIPA